MIFTVQFERGKNGDPLTRIGRKIAFPPRGAMINLNSAYEVEVTGENKVDGAYFLKILQEFREAFPEPIEREIELDRWHSDGTLHISPEESSKIIDKPVLERRGAFKQQGDAGRYRVRLWISGVKEHGKMFYERMDILECIETVAQRQRARFGGLTHEEVSKIAVGLAEHYTLTENDLGFDIMKLLHEQTRAFADAQEVRTFLEQKVQNILADIESGKRLRYRDQPIHGWGHSDDDWGGGLHDYTPGSEFRNY